MRILHVIRSENPLLGGPSQAIIHITRALAELGAEVHVVSTESRQNWENGVVCGRELMKHSVSHRYFVTTKFTSWAFSESIWQWLRLNISNYDLVHIHGVFTFPPLAAMFLARRQGVKYVVRPAGTLNSWGLTQKVVKKKVFRFLVLDRLLKSSSSIHATSRSEAESLSKLGLGVPISVVPLGIPTRSVAPHSIASVDGSITLFFLGRLHPVKNIPFLLRVMRQISQTSNEVKLLIAGSGTREYVMELEAMVSSLKVGHLVTFVGFADSKKKVDLIATADVFVLPSFQESFGVAVVEAMSQGVPVIVSENVALSGEIQRAGAGFSVTVDGIEDFLAAVSSLRNSSNRRVMGNNAARLVREKYSIEAMGKNLTSYYESVLNENMYKEFSEK